jgi:hypothetical protein
LWLNCNLAVLQPKIIDGPTFFNNRGGEEQKGKNELNVHDILRTFAQHATAVRSLHQVSLKPFFGQKSTAFSN